MPYNCHPIRCHLLWSHHINPTFYPSLTFTPSRSRLLSSPHFLRTAFFLSHPSLSPFRPFSSTNGNIQTGCEDRVCQNIILNLPGGTAKYVTLCTNMCRDCKTSRRQMRRRDLLITLLLYCSALCCFVHCVVFRPVLCCDVLHCAAFITFNTSQHIVAHYPDEHTIALPPNRPLFLFLPLFLQADRGSGAVCVHHLRVRTHPGACTGQHGDRAVEVSAGLSWAGLGCSHQ